MDETVEEAAAEPLWKVIRLSLPISDRKTLLAIAVGFATITAGTTYVFVKYREKKRKKSLEQSSTLEDSEEVELDRTPPSTSSLEDVSFKSGSAIDDKFIYSTGSSALSEISTYSTKSISSPSDTERAKTSFRKEDQIVKKTPTKKPQEGYLVKKTPSKIEIAKTQEQDSCESDENRERSLLVKDILPSISLEERDEGPPLSRQVDDEERSSISVSIGSLRAPVVEIKPAAQSTPDELITEKVEVREGITEKVKDVASQPKIIPSPNREKLPSKVLSQIKTKSQLKVGTEHGRKSKNISKNVTPSKHSKQWRTVNLKPRKHSKVTQHHKKHKSKTKRRGLKTKKKEKSKGKRKK